MIDFERGLSWRGLSWLSQLARITARDEAEQFRPLGALNLLNSFWYSRIARCHPGSRTSPG